MVNIFNELETKIKNDWKLRELQYVFFKTTEEISIKYTIIIE